MPEGAQVARVICESASEFINISCNDLAGRAIEDAPVDTGTLRGSAGYPAVDPSHAATPEELEGTVSFNTVYAAAQEVGEMYYLTHDNTKIVHWVVRNHPKGGKSHYLEDQVKVMAGRYEAAMGTYVARALKQRFG